MNLQLFNLGSLLNIINDNKSYSFILKSERQSICNCAYMLWFKLEVCYCQTTALQKSSSNAADSISQQIGHPQSKWCCLLTVALCCNSWSLYKVQFRYTRGKLAICSFWNSFSCCCILTDGIVESFCHYLK